MNKVALVVAGGDEPPAWTIDDVAPAVVIAADRGADHARTLGLAPDIVVGDFDSISDGSLAWARSIGARLVRHPSDKPFTDLELALDEAENFAVDSVVIIGGAGGRSDHVVGNLAAAAAARPFSVELRDAGGITWVLRHGRTFHGSPGDSISLLPWGGSVTGVTTDGLRWPLTDATLSPFAALGVSNEFLGQDARVEIESGVLLVVVPRSD